MRFGEGGALRAIVIRQRPAGSRVRAYPDLSGLGELRRPARTGHDATPAAGGSPQRMIPGPRRVTPTPASPARPQPRRKLRRWPSALPCGGDGWEYGGEGRSGDKMADAATRVPTT